MVLFLSHWARLQHDPPLPGLKSWFNFSFFLLPFYRKNQILCIRKTTKQFLFPFIFTQHLFWWPVRLLLKDGMIVLNTVVALLPDWLITALIIFRVSFESLPCSDFFFPFKNNGNFLCFLFGRKCWIVTSCFFALPEQTALFCFSHNWDPTNLAPFKKWNNLFVEASLV